MPYRQPNGKWRAHRMIDGKRRQRVFTSKAEAKAWEAGQDAEAWSQEDKPTITAFSWADAYLNHAKTRHAHKTYQEKCVAFRALFRHVNPDCPADSIPKAAIYAALSARAVASGNAANKDRKNLGAAWEWGRKVLGLPRENPFRDVERFGHDARPRYVPSEADFWAAVGQAAPEDRTFLLVALHTAARRGELFRLMWPDVDIPGRKIRLGTRKTAHGGLEYEWLHLTSVAANALAEHRKTAMRGMHVFTQPDGELFTSRQHLMERICARAGVKRFGFHAIRHLSASILAREGVDIPTIQAILRHKSPTTTARYMRSLGVVSDVLEGVFGGSVGQTKQRLESRDG